MNIRSLVRWTEHRQFPKQCYQRTRLERNRIVDLAHRGQSAFDEVFVLLRLLRIVSDGRSSVSRLIVSRLSEVTHKIVLVGPK